MPRQLLRVVETRRLDNPDDNRTGPQIAATDASAANLEVYLQTAITQLRRIMGTVDWKDDPPATIAYLLANMGVQEANLIWEEELSGIKNSSNLVFTTANKFVLGTLRVYFNGQRLHSGIENDYAVSESGGVGTGYDTVTFTSPELAPKPGESVLADYLKD